MVSMTLLSLPVQMLVLQWVGLVPDAAIEVRDVVLMTDEPSKLVDAIEVAKSDKTDCHAEYSDCLGIKSVFLILAPLVLGMWKLHLVMALP